MNADAELNLLSLEILRLMDEYITLQKNLESRMNHGYLHLTKARYIMGEKHLSSTQIPYNELTATTKSFRDSNDDGTTFRIGDENTKSGIQNITKRPINWFGLLTPQSLKSADVSFSKSIQLAGDLASLSMKIQKSIQKFEGLLEKQA